MAEMKPLTPAQKKTLAKQKADFDKKVKAEVKKQMGKLGTAGKTPAEKAEMLKRNMLP